MCYCMYIIVSVNTPSGSHSSYSHKRSRRISLYVVCYTISNAMHDTNFLVSFSLLKFVVPNFRILLGSKLNNIASCYFFGWQSIIITIMSIIIFTSDLSENWRVQQSPDQLAAQSQHHPWSIANINHVSHNYEWQ